MRVVDCSIDHGWATPGELLEYLPRAWREYVGEPGSLPGGGGARSLIMNSAYTPPERAAPGLAFAGSLAPAVADVGSLQREWLDPQGIDVGVLVAGAARTTAACVNPHLAKVLVRAVNDWTVERWLDADDSGRVRGTILVPEQVPTDAADEVRRLAGDPRMAAILVGASGTGKPAGHPIWDPLYEAAVETGLPVLIHAGGDAVQDSATYPTAGGPPSTFAELRALAAQGLMTHLVSLIGQGTFEKHPGLRVVLAGGGFSWLPSIMWRFDTNFRALRVEVPWVKRPPSAYLREHVRVVAAPLDGPREPRDVALMATAYPDFADVVCYGSGFPGRPTTLPGDLGDVLPEAWVSPICSDNASWLTARS